MNTTRKDQLIVEGLKMIAEHLINEKNKKHVRDNKLHVINEQVHVTQC